MLFQKLLTQINNIDEKSVIEQRKIILQPLIDYINLKHNNREEVRLNFICTHNSRRSHLAQVWAQTIAQYFNLRQVFCYSGGTESTSIYIAAVKALKQFGFEIDVIADNDNPVYSIKYSLNQPPIIGFSKCFDHPFNPKTDFAAILTCSDADEGCPFIEGADVRIPMTFEDPKAYDNTKLQSEKYIQRGLQIATELKYVFSKVNTKV
jgi:arsenate reductase